MMRKFPGLGALLRKIRQDILTATPLSPQEWWYPSDLASHLGTSPSSLQRELDSLTDRRNQIKSFNTLNGFFHADPHMCEC